MRDCLSSQENIKLNDYKFRVDGSMTIRPKVIVKAAFWMVKSYQQLANREREILFENTNSAFQDRFIRQCQLTATSVVFPFLSTFEQRPNRKSLNNGIDEMFTHRSITINLAQVQMIFV